MNRIRSRAPLRAPRPFLRRRTAWWQRLLARVGRLRGAARGLVRFDLEESDAVPELPRTAGARGLRRSRGRMAAAGAPAP